MVVVVALAALWVSRVSVPGDAPQGCRDGCAVDRMRPPGPLRIMTFNVWHDFPRHRHLRERLVHLAGEIDRLAIDIVSLQEAPWTFRIGNAAAFVAGRTGMNHLYFRANGNRRAIGFEEGVAILSRFPLASVTTHELRPHVGLFDNRVVLRVEVIAGNAPIAVYATHLRRPIARGDEQVPDLIRFVDAGARTGFSVIAGDLNSPGDAPWMHRLLSQWVDTHDLATAGQPAATCCRDKHRLDGTRLVERRVDYVLVRGPRARESVRSSRVVLDEPFLVEGEPVWPSDHAGVLTEIAWPP